MASSIPSIAGCEKGKFADAVRLFLVEPTPPRLEAVLRTAIEVSSGHVYRREQISLFRRALKSCPDGAWQDLPDVCRRLVDQASHTRHARSQAAEVGSTLSLKGLEYEHVILVDPSETPTREHLYVALSRATRRITLATSPGKGLGRWLAV
jgi:DNA helicase-2/ATP-dependent DNA helicase PcrA